MKIEILAFTLFVASANFAQQNSPAAILNQIPPVPDLFLCDEANANDETQALISSLNAQVESMITVLEEQVHRRAEISFSELSPVSQRMKNSTIG